MVNLAILLVPLAFSSVFGELTVRYEWKYIDYEWENDQQKQNATNEGHYVPKNIFPIDVQQVSDGRIFVTTPRGEGVPATLSIITNEIGEGGPLLRPYPNWEWNSRTDCTGLNTVFRVTIDSCNRLYVLDTGEINHKNVCPAQLLIFDLSTDSLIERVTIPSEYAANANGSGSLCNLAVETRGIFCKQTRVYMADFTGWGLVVWNGTSLRRYESDSFDPVPEYMNYTIVGDTFQLADGIFSLALQPNKMDSWKSTDLFYRPIGSLNQYSVSIDHMTGQLRRSSDGELNYKTLNYTFPTQVSGQSFSSDGILFSGYSGTTSIGCWNSNKPMNDENVAIVAQNEETLQFASSVKVTDDQLWVFTIRMQNVVLGKVNVSEVNYRIHYEPKIRNLVEGTNCQVHGKEVYRKGHLLSG